MPCKRWTEFKLCRNHILVVKLFEQEIKGDFYIVYHAGFVICQSNRPQTGSSNRYWSTVPLALTTNNFPIISQNISFIYPGFGIQSPSRIITKILPTYYEGRSSSFFIYYLSFIIPDAFLFVSIAGTTTNLNSVSNHCCSQRNIIDNQTRALLREVTDSSEILLDREGISYRNIYQCKYSLYRLQHAYRKTVLHEIK